MKQVLKVNTRNLPLQADVSPSSVLSSVWSIPEESHLLAIFLAVVGPGVCFQDVQAVADKSFRHLFIRGREEGASKEIYLWMVKQIHENMTHHEMYNKVLKLFSQRSTDVPALLPLCHAAKSS